MAAGRYLLVYDIGEDRERTKVERMACGFGLRVQKSVFECRLSRRQHSELVRRLQALKLSSGHVRIYRVDGRKPAATIGQPPATTLTEDAAAWILGGASNA